MYIYTFVFMYVCSAYIFTCTYHWCHVLYVQVLFIHIYMYTHVYIYICIHVYMYIHICMYTSLMSSALRTGFICIHIHVFTHTCIYIHLYPCMYVHTHLHVPISDVMCYTYRFYWNTYTCIHMYTGWRSLIASPQLQIIFHKRATKYRPLLRKMTYENKGSYESSPPCVCKFVFRYVCTYMYTCTYH